MPALRDPQTTSFRNLTPAAFADLRFGEHLRRIWIAASDMGLDGRLIRGLRSTGELSALVEIDVAGQTFCFGAGTVHRGAMGAGNRHINGSAVQLTSSKMATKTLLAENDVPVPFGRTFDAAHRADALAFALGLGGLVCVKPESGAKGTLVFPSCRSQFEIEAALDAVFASSALALVERNVGGDIYRLIYCEPVVAGTRINRPLTATGDGVSTIAELAAAINVERTQRANPLHPPIEHGADTAAHLDSLGLTMDSVPEAGHSVTLSPVSNFARGGAVAINIGTQMHPSYIEIAERAFRALPGLKLGGMDMAIVDASVPASPDNCAVIEINSSPTVDVSYNPWIGEPQDVAAALVRTVRDRLSPAVTPPRRLDEHARLLADAADAQGIRTETVELLGASGTDLYLRLFVGGTVFQYRQGAMRVWQPDDPAGPGRHINGDATRITTSDTRAHKVLRRAGLNVPLSAVFTRDQVEEAKAFAAGVGEVVIRSPSDKNDIPESFSDSSGVATAITRLSRTSPRILVEQASRGQALAFFVAGGRAVAAIRAGCRRIVGDGRSPIVALVRQQTETGLLDAHEVVCSQGLDFGSVPAPGQVVFYTRVATIADGALAAPGEIHPDYWRLAAEAAAAIDGLRLGAVRMSVADPTATAGPNDRILRVSSSPGIASFCGDAPGRDAPACTAILDLLRTYRA